MHSRVWETDDRNSLPNFPTLKIVFGENLFFLYGLWKSRVYIYIHMDIYNTESFTHNLTQKRCLLMFASPFACFRGRAQVGSLRWNDQCVIFPVGVSSLPKMNSLTFQNFGAWWNTLQVSIHMPPVKRKILFKSALVGDKLVLLEGIVIYQSLLSKPVVLWTFFVFCRNRFWNHSWPY